MLSCSTSCISCYLKSPCFRSKPLQKHQQPEREIKKRGVTLWTWTIDNLERMKEVVDSGVQGITSNQPQRLFNLEMQ